MTGCLQEAMSEVALRGYSNLDELSQIHIRSLACLCFNDVANIKKVAIYIDRNELDTSELLDRLCEFNFAEESFGDYQSTEIGKDICYQIGIQMLGMDIFKMNGELESSKRLLDKLAKN
jgi:hypothetical protein